jgi:pyrimidine-nucleoside phosphorylase
MDVRAVLAKKRDGGALSRDEIDAFMRGYVDGKIADYQAASLLTSIFIRGMTHRELAEWTRAMLDSGERLSFPHVAQPKVDKHSTGGVGDKVSIPLAPAVAACGVAVPMISGRGLGHTGGTLDKLESIPGFRTQLSREEFARTLAETGCALGGQTPEIAPADRKLYALRDATGLIESIPLIASSILSKKLAEGIDALVLDVKFGSGAFLPEPERGAELARTMIDLARSMGVRASAFQTAMDRPLGRTAGHALEIRESIDCLRGRGPEDLEELVLLQGGEMLRLAGVAKTIAEARERVRSAIASGAALETFARVIEAQGGDPRVVDEPDRLDAVATSERVVAHRGGTFAYCDVRSLGRALNALGGGRSQLGDAIDPAVGLVFHAQHGARVAPGETLIEIAHRDGRGLELACELARSAFTITDGAACSPLVLAEIREESPARARTDRS